VPLWAVLNPNKNQSYGRLAIIPEEKSIVVSGKPGTLNVYKLPEVFDDK
jgi:hypothetical protein